MIAELIVTLDDGDPDCGAVLDVAIAGVTLARAGELLQDQRVVLRVEPLGLVLTPATDERKGPFVRVFTSPRPEGLEDGEGRRREDAGGRRAGEAQAGAAGRRRAGPAGG